MPVSPDLLAIEEAAVRGWPALETADIDGWLWRFTSGGSVRANTVAALRFRGADLGLAIERAIALYRARGAVPRFTVSQASAPAGLDGALAARGFMRKGSHVTLAKDIATPSAARPALEVTTAAEPTEAWMEVYLAGLSPDRRGVAPCLVRGVPAPRRFFAGWRDGQVVSTGLTVVDGTLASVQCMATRPEARRTGGATAVLAALEAFAAATGAQRLYLQTDAGNAAALSLYQRFGFTLAGCYHTRDLES